MQWYLHLASALHLRSVSSKIGNMQCPFFGGWNMGATWRVTRYAPLAPYSIICIWRPSQSEQARLRSINPLNPLKRTVTLESCTGYGTYGRTKESLPIEWCRIPIPPRSHFSWPEIHFYVKRLPKECNTFGLASCMHNRGEISGSGGNIYNFICSHVNYLSGGRWKSTN